MDQQATSPGAGRTPRSRTSSDRRDETPGPPRTPGTPDTPDTPGAPDASSTTPSAPADLIDADRTEAALVEHYPHLVRLAYLVLPSGTNRSRRVLSAHAVVQRALPRRGVTARGLALPDVPEGAEAADLGYAVVRARVLRRALAAGRTRWGLPAPPAPLPQVWGLRLSPRSGGADELALDQALSRLSGPGRAAYALRGLERLTSSEAHRVLAAAGVRDPRTALEEADGVPRPAGSRDGVLLESAEFDPCALVARPTDLVRRRQHVRALLAAGAALLVCGALLGLPGGGWAPDGAAGPPYARNAAAEAALDPGKLRVTSAGAWKRAARTDFAAWPARGERIGDRALLRRALAVWARPGPGVAVSATPGTASGPAAGPPQLLFAGRVAGAAVVLFHDGLRAVRYAEPADEAGDGGVALDFARTDGATGPSATALVVSRTDGRVRYLTAPWVRAVHLVDLRQPEAAGERLGVDAHGVTAPAPVPPGAAAPPSPPSPPAPPSASCAAWPALRMDGRLLTDLGELTPARLTYGAPGGPGEVGDAPGGPGEVGDAPGRTVWARTACRLPALHGLGVRAVNSWEFARQPLPGGAGEAAWVCTRAETWRGSGSRTFAQFQAPPPDGPRHPPGAVAAGTAGGTACGPRAPRVVAGVLWKAADGQWWLLAAGSRQVGRITASGGVRGEVAGRLLALPARSGAHAQLTGHLPDGGTVTGLG